MARVKKINKKDLDQMRPGLSSSQGGSANARLREVNLSTTKKYRIAL